MGQKLRGELLVEALNSLTGQRGAPKYLHYGVHFAFFRLGKRPTMPSLRRLIDLRDERLTVRWFETTTEAHPLIEDWRIDYNESCSQIALGNIPPGKYALRARISTEQAGSSAVEN